MTANQLRYAELREGHRHNTTVEKETGRHNVETERIGYGTLAETSRHNKAYEGIQSALAAETARHNVATEGINWYSAQNLANLQFAQANKTTSEVGETTRHNLATEGIQSGQLEETSRHNLATEQYNINALGEQFRHNKQTELQGWISTGAGAYKDVSTGLRQNVESVKGIINGVKSILPGG
nr:MAG TPA: hypothetical protein [Picobirnaviridae sp.]